MILNHLSVGVTDLTVSRDFYDAVLATLSIKRTHDIENLAAAYGDKLGFWIQLPSEGKASAGNGTHIAFNAPTKQAVDTFYATAIQQGGTCEGKPGLRPEIDDAYYAAFVRDPDGNKIEAALGP